MDAEKENIKPFTLSVSGVKGGSGKSTVSSNTSVSFAVKGHPTVYIDRDYEHPTAIGIFEHNVRNPVLLDEIVTDYAGIKDEFSKYTGIICDHIKEVKSGTATQTLKDKAASVSADARNDGLPKLVESLINRDSSSYRSLMLTEGKDIDTAVRDLDSKDVEAAAQQLVDKEFDSRVRLDKIVTPTDIPNLWVVLSTDSTKLSNMHQRYPELATKLNKFFQGLNDKGYIVVNDMGAGKTELKIEPFSDGEYKALVLNQDVGSLSGAASAVRECIDHLVTREFSTGSSVDSKALKFFERKDISYGYFFDYFDVPQKGSQLASQIEIDLGTLEAQRQGKIRLKQSTKEIDVKIGELTKKYESIHQDFSEDERNEVKDRLVNVRSRFDDNTYAVMNRVGADRSDIAKAVSGSIDYYVQFMTTVYYEYGVKCRYFGKEGLTQFVPPKDFDTPEKREEIRNLIIRAEMGDNIPYNNFVDRVVSPTMKINEKNMIRNVSNIDTINGAGFFTAFKSPTGEYELVGGPRDRKKMEGALSLDGGITLNQFADDMIDKMKI